MVSRALLRRAIEGLVEWERNPSPRDGYTVVLGCAHALPAILRANLELLSRQRMPRGERVIVVVDASASSLPPSFEPRARVAGLELEFVYYTERQARAASRLRWGWINSWLSWSIGIARCGTRHALLHDFDALLLAPGLVERRYDAILAQQVEYLGVDRYRGLGVVGDDLLVRTFELMFDAAFVREHFRPIDLFNRMGSLAGRLVEFDTFLYAQSRAGRRGVLAIDEEHMVHPSQMICQYVDHTAGRALPAAHNLFMLPYYEALGGDERALWSATTQLRGAGTVEIYGRPVDASRMPCEHAAWLEKQAFRLETALYGGVRPHVRAYFEGLRNRGERPSRGKTA
jgi:hypothetical protein